MCIPGGDTQNTEALHPGLKLLQGKHGGHEGHQMIFFVGLSFKVSKSKIVTEEEQNATD